VPNGAGRFVETTVQLQLSAPEDFVAP
jgi:hypothetical protein